MSRLHKYKESLHRFIKEKSCLNIDNGPCKTCDSCINNVPCTNPNLCPNCKDCTCATCPNCKKVKTSLLCDTCMLCNTCTNCQTCDKDLNSYIYSLILNNDSVHSTLFLTIMNNQNKKNHMSIQGYHIATSIEFFNVLINIIENKENVINMFGLHKYIKLCNNLFIYANKSWQQNIESVKNIYLPHNITNIILTSMNLANDTFKNIMDLTEHKFEILNNSCNFNIVDWYLKNNSVLTKKFTSLSQVSKESLNSYINRKYHFMSKLAISLGWIFGNGSINGLNNFNNTYKYFGKMCKLSRDFECLERDIDSSVVYSTNYVLNFGLQEGYEEFVNNKQLFIEDMLTEDIYSSTIKEIIDKLEADIDIVIDQTSPDLKSSYSMSNSNKK